MRRIRIRSPALLALAAPMLAGCVTTSLWSGYGDAHFAPARREFSPSEPFAENALADATIRVALTPFAVGLDVLISPLTAFAEDPVGTVGSVVDSVEDHRESRKERKRRKRERRSRAENESISSREAEPLTPR